MRSPIRVTLFALNTEIARKHGNNKTQLDTLSIEKRTYSKSWGSSSRGINELNKLLSFRHPLERRFFARSLFPNKNVFFFVFFYHILSGTICRFYFCALFSSIYCKFNFTAKNEPRYFFIRNYILFLISDAKLLMSHNSIVKLSGVLNKWNFLKTCIQSTYPINFCIICSNFYYGLWRKWIFFNY